MHSLRSIEFNLDDFERKCESKCMTAISSPKYHATKLNETIHRAHYFDFDMHPCDLYFHNLCHLDGIQEQKSSEHSTNRIGSPKHLKSPMLLQITDSRSSECEEKPILSEKKEFRRAKSCPKDFFSSPKCGMFNRNNEPQMNQSSQLNREEFTPCTSSTLRKRTPNMRTIPQIKTHKPKSKTPNSMDDFLSSKLVRNNLASSLRHKWSRKKINDMTEEKLKSSMDVSKFIPKCHQWNVRSTPGWKSFSTEEYAISVLLHAF